MSRFVPLHAHTDCAEMRSGSEGAGAGSTFRHSGWRPLPLRAQQDLNLRVDVEKGSVSKFVQPPRRPASHDESSTRTRRKVPTGTLDDVAIVEHLSMARAKLCNSIRALMAQAPSEAEQQPCEGCMSTTRLNERVIMPCGRKIRLCCPCARLYGRMLTARLAQVKADNALVTAKSSPLPKLPQEHATAPVLNLGLGGSFGPRWWINHKRTSHSKPAHSEVETRFFKCASNEFSKTQECGPLGDVPWAPCFGVGVPTVL